MKKQILLTVLMGTLLILSQDLLATPIPGSINEVRNGDFENGEEFLPPPEWEVKDNEVVIAPGLGNPGNSAGCFKPLPQGEWGNRMRQVVDETTNPLWNPDLGKKVVDLQADIRGFSDDIFGTPDTGEGIRFRLDYWSEQFNDEDDPNNLPDPTFFTEWISFLDPNSDTWTTVNPFNRLQLDIQPRWLSVEIEFMQPDLTMVWVDNVILTSQCVPEPTTMILLGAGLIGLAGLSRKRLRRVKKIGSWRVLGSYLIITSMSK